MHWKGRGPSSRVAFGVRVGKRRRLRLSFDFKLFIEPSECLDPYEYAELYEPKEPDDMFVKPVSRDVIDGALNSEKLALLSFDVSLR